jgi:hypothetical protein
MNRAMTNFVERRLEFTTGGEVVLRIFQPKEDDANTYRCDYEIEWPDRRRSMYGFGVDAMQALVGAMCNAHADLLSSPEGKSGALRWCGMTDLGLPLAGSLTPKDFA